MDPKFSVVGFVGWIRNCTKPFVALALAATLAAGIAACGSTNTAATNGVSTSVASSGASSASDVQGVANAAKAVTSFLSEPQSLTGLTPLPSSPTKKTVGLVSCSEPICQLLISYAEKAVTALGWKYDTVVATATDPGQAIQQLVDAGVNYILENAYDANTFAPQMRELKQQKIPLFEIASTDPAEGPKNGIYADISGGTSQYQWGEIETDWAIAQSKGHADILDVNIPSYPVLQAQASGEQAAVKANCPSCQFHSLNVTVNDVTTNAIPGEVVSYLQSNPDINYLHFTDPQDSNGIVPALRTAGLLGKVKIYGSSAQAAEFAAVGAGEESAWQADPQPQAFWAVADQMARVATGAWSESEAAKAALIPWFLVTNKTQAAEFGKSTQPYPWAGPTGYEATYKHLWHVG